MVDEMNKMHDFIDMSEMDVKLLNPLVWAYIGDAIYEAYVRSYLISRVRVTVFDLHRKSIKYVSAKSQSDLLEKIIPTLDEEELNIVRRGRNTKNYHVPKNAGVIEYRRATALEALVGYLYLLKRFDRVNQIMNTVFIND